MKSAIAILTYRRLHALTAMMAGVGAHCGKHACGIFEDCGQRDNTAGVLQQHRKPVARREMLAIEYVPESDAAYMPKTQVFMGEKNLGVAGNSNRALKWFMDGDWDHLCLCNDDMFVLGDFVSFYAQAHQDLGVGMFCFCDFTEQSPAISGAAETYKWTTYPFRGYQVKFLPRFTGIMMSVTRALVEKIGFFDAVFGQFGEEHCDYTIRARMAGGIQLNGQDMNCLDVDHSLLKHQDVETSLQGAQRRKANNEAAIIMPEVAKSYRWRHPFRPYRLTLPRWSGGYRGGGILTQRLLDCGYAFVTDLQH